MKKKVKIISTILLIVMALTSVMNVVFATGGGITGAISNLNPTGNPNSDVIGFGQKIVNIIQTVGIVIAVVIILVIGIQYIMGSAEQKAEYKKTMMPYLIGALLLFAGVNIVKVVYNLSTELTK